MIRQQGLNKIARYIESIMSHAVIFSGGAQVQVDFYKKTVDGNRVEIWVKVPDHITVIDKFQILDTDNEVFIERSKALTRRSGRALLEIFSLEVREVSE